MTEEPIKKYVSALLSKPFVILTGNSGTGKTRMAIKFAEALESATVGTEQVELIVDKNGKIKNKPPEQIKELCRNTNEFKAELDGKNVFVTIEMSGYIESEDSSFIQIIENNTESTVLLILSENTVEKRHLLVPVGADWTDSHHLLGYINPFGHEGKTYEVTSALRLILRAAEPDNRKLPYFLILDEMNLSHVERYFSTFLSVMEADRSSGSANPIIDSRAIKLISKVLSEDEDESSEVRMASELSSREEPLTLPQNLFIVGTVNIDETTYMFSPKVLDRAHVIELHTETPSSYAAESKSEDFLAGKKSDEILTHFAASIIKRRKKQLSEPFEALKASTTDKKRYDEIEGTIKIVLDGLYTLLEPVGFDFGYRTINEFLDYISVCESFEPGGDWITAVDRAVLQKVLPKIHGNRRQLGDCLKALELFFAGQESKYSVGQQESGAESTGIELKESLSKIARMVRSLEYTGYTSYIS